MKEEELWLREKDGRSKGYMICATKTIKASAQACFDAFASAHVLDRWLGEAHALDFREGGELRNSDGNAATIRKINPGKAIKLVWGCPALSVASTAKAVVRNTVWMLSLMAAGVVMGHPSSRYLRA